MEDCRNSEHDGGANEIATSQVAGRYGDEDCQNGFSNQNQLAVALFEQAITTSSKKELYDTATRYAAKFWFEDEMSDVKSTKIKLLKTVAFIIDELTRDMKASQTIEDRTDILNEIERVASIGSACKSSNMKAINALQRKLKLILVRPIVRRIWSLPLAAFNPKENLYRELAFSYQ